MTSLTRSASALRTELDRVLAREVEEACSRALALARLEEALSAGVEEIDHPALSLDRRQTPAGRTYTLRLLGIVLMQWCFSDRCADVYCWCRGRSREPDHLRFSFAAGGGEWQISMPGRRPALGRFSDEEAKVLELVRDAIRSLSPWSDPSGTSW